MRAPDLSASVEAFASQISILPEPLSVPFQDPVARLGSELAVLTSTVANRERELNRLFDLIAVERNALLDAVLNRMFDSLGGVIPFDRVGCSFLAENGTATFAYWSRSNAGEAHIPTGYQSPLEDAALIEMLRTGRPLIINDLIARMPAADLFHRLLAEGCRSTLTCPLIADGTPLGFLFFASSAAAVYTSAHAATFMRVAAQVSVVVQKTRAYGEVVSANRLLLNETRRLHQAATTDALTGVLNRRALDDAIASAWRRHQRGERSFGLIMCDIDHFKAINDTHGHAVGDAVLSQAARRMERCLRGHDVFGRYGGEEFLAIVDTDSETQLLDVAERLRARMARTPFGELAVTASFGAAIASQFDSLESMIAAADRALYAAKGQGRNRCVVCSGEDRAALTRQSPTPCTTSVDRPGPRLVTRSGRRT
jgi:diguanylate cyclase (GGDEF)-like protein